MNNPPILPQFRCFHSAMMMISKEMMLIQKLHIQGVLV